MSSDYLMTLALSVRIIELFVATFILSKVYKIYRKERSHAVLHAVAILLATILLVLVQFFLIIINPADVTLGSTDTIFGILIGTLTVFFIDHYAYNEISTARTAILSFLAAMNITLILIFTSQEFHILLTELGLFWMVLVFSGIVLFYFYVAFSIVSTLKSISRYYSPVQKQAVKYLYLYILFSFGLISITYVIAYALFQDKSGSFPATDPVVFWMTIVPPILYIIALIFFFMGYARYESGAMIHPQRVEKLVIVSNHGLPIYDLDLGGGSEIDDTLLSGAITAITSVLRESTSSTGNLEYLQMGGKSMIFESNEQSFGLLITEHPTRYLKDAIVSIMARLTELDLEDFNTLSDEEYKHIDVIVKSYFGHK